MLHHASICESSNERALVIIRHNFSTRNSDHVGLLIKTGNTHKRIMLHTLIHTLKSVRGRGVKRS